jgi:MFS family permease
VSAGRGRSRRAVVAVLATAGLCSSFMLTLVVPIQAELPRYLDASREDTLWVVTATLLASAVATPIAGRLGDMYGKRRIVLALLVLLVAGSVLAALSPGIGGVIAGRALQGASVGIVPLGISILRDILDERRLHTGIALISATMGVGGAIGLPLSAAIAQGGQWRSLFWISAGLGLVVFVLVAWIVPVSVLRSGGSFDYVGAVLLSAGLVGVLVAVARGGDWGWLSAGVLASGLGGLVILVVWGWLSVRSRSPLLDLRVARRRPVLLTNLASIAVGFALFTANVTYPQLLVLPVDAPAGLGLPLLEASLLLAPAGLVMMAVAPLAGRIVRRVGARMLLALGSALLVVSYGFSVFFATEIWQIVAANLVYGVGIGFALAAMPMLIMQSVPASETGESNGVNALSRSLGTSLASAIVGALLAGMSVDVAGAQIPTSAAFTSSFLLGAAAALLAVVLALLVPRHPDPREPRPSLPGGTVR